jgi:hypothetical protein
MIIMLFTTACGPGKSVTDEEAAPNPAPYRDVLGRLLTDQPVADFINSNQCSSVLPYFLCKEKGMALLISSNQQVEGVFLYVNKSAGFVPFEDDLTPYKGELPFGLKFYDTMGAVEYKLNRQGVGNHGLPDSGSTPDHIHYVAFYKEAGLTIIYNSPEDEDALIHAILVQK